MALTLDGVTFDDREIAEIVLAKAYEQLGNFGAPNHLSMVVIQKLARLVEMNYSFVTNAWKGKGKS
jgi:hypothetical protein